MLISPTLAGGVGQQIRQMEYAMTDRVGQQFGNYTLIKLLGRGGFAEVYLGKHRYLKGYAALKMLQTTLHPVDERIFWAEAQRLVDLRHPNIVRLLDFGVEHGTPVLIMDYAPKGSLRQAYPYGTQLPLSTIVDIVVQIAEALQYAHTHHVIHRDIKPENILLDTENRPLLSDFGLSLHTPSAQPLSMQDLAGTPRYMAPEQLHGQPCFATDQYALAVMVYEWLCGEHPFRGTLWEILHQHQATVPPSLRGRRPDLSAPLEKVVLRAMEKQPEDRFVSVQGFAWALARESQTSLPVKKDDSQATAPMHLLSRALPAAPLLPEQTRDVLQSPQAPAFVFPESFPRSALQHQNRMRLLQRVRSFWIAGVLEQSLHGAASMTLKLQEQPDAVANVWHLILQEFEHAGPPLPAGTRITHVYDQAHGELLILGEPGSGKTTLLLELTRDLLARAEREQAHLMPVVFNLSSWMRKRQPLHLWLVEELETKYLVPRKVGADWITTDQILPLLDGLDEVDASTRPACIQAINEYHQTHSLVPLVVCCRMNDYRVQAQRLVLGRAVTIQPLTAEQINTYFSDISERATPLHMAFQRDPVLQELVTTPLMLTILVMAYQGSSVEELHRGASADILQQHIFTTYTRRMLQRRSVRSRYRLEQTIHWLSYLAWQMKRQSQSVLYIERLQPNWLMRTWQRRVYAGLIAGPIWGLLVGLVFLYNPPFFLLVLLITTLIVGLLFGWVSDPQRVTQGTQAPPHLWMRFRQRLAAALENRTVVGIVAGLTAGTANALYSYLVDSPGLSAESRFPAAIGYGLIIGIYVGLPLGLAIRLERRIEPMEALGWSWIGIRRNIVRWLLISIGIGSVQGLIFALPLLLSGQGAWIPNFLTFGLWATLNFALIITLINGVERGLSKRILDAEHIVTPNQGIWRSARYGAAMAGCIGAISIVFAGAGDWMRGFSLPLAKYTIIDHLMVNITGDVLGFFPTTRQEFLTLHIIFIALRSGAILSLAAGLYCGGAAYVQHFTLRFLLWFTRCAPLDYPRFLDYAAERILMRKVGGSYMFIHRLLLEYFASVWECERETEKAYTQELAQHGEGSLSEVPA